MVKRELETPRHLLRPITLVERAELHALWTDEKVRRWLFDDREIALEVVDDLVTASDALAERGMGHWSVRGRKDGRLIGTAALRPIEDDDVELIYLLAPAEWRQGHATEVARVLLDHAFGTLGLERVVAQADVANIASLAVMKRIGMRFDKELEIDGRPLVQYAMERDRGGS